MKEWHKLLLLIGVFLFAYFLPVTNPLPNDSSVNKAIIESFVMLQDYARKHILFCLVPAFFIAGAISVFVSKNSVMRYFGASAKKILSYGVASVSGTILAVCSCTVLPLFSSIYKRGAGLGPAITFLYSGPAINILAIILTARVLGFELGLIRALGAILLSVIVGFLMAITFRREEEKRQVGSIFLPEEEETRKPWQTITYFISMIIILVFSAWGYRESLIYKIKWYVVILALIGLISELIIWFKRDELTEWVLSTWDFIKKITPLLFGGVLVAGFLLGLPDHNNGIIPSEWVIKLVGGNSISSNLFAAISGALMYFATLTEVPILQGLMGAGMGKGPALSLLLAGPALSLPNMLVIRSVIGTKKTLIFILYVTILSAIVGYIFGEFF